MPRIIDAFTQFLDGEGNPLVNGKLRFLVSGTNNTDKDTYADSSETIANTNPLILDAEGRCPNVFGTGSYRVISYDSDGQQIQQFDPVPGGSESAGDFSFWNGTTKYSPGDIVKSDDLIRIYRSLNDNNTGNALTDETNWEEIRFYSIWNENKAYLENDLMLYTDMSLYTALSDTNSGETPVTHPAKWESASNVFKNPSELKNDLGILTGGTQDIDLRIANVVLATVSTAEQTFTFSNANASNNTKFEFYITDGGSQTVNWPASLEWVGGSSPTLTSDGLDLLVFSTNDAGSTWYGFVAGLDIKAAA